MHEGRQFRLHARHLRGGHLVRKEGLAGACDLPELHFAGSPDFWRDKLEPEDTAAFLGIAFFLLMFLPIPFMDKAALQASWSPRLILAPLLYFSWAAFLLLDRTIVAKWGKIAFVILALVLVQCGIGIVFLT